MESLNNVARHARAGKVRISLEINNGHGKLIVRDNGKGFELTELNKEGHLGVRGMRERVAGVGGEFRMESAPNEGTSVSVYV